MRSGPGRPPVHSQVNPPGSKGARKMLKRSGLKWRGQVINTSELTKANEERAIERAAGRTGKVAIKRKVSA